MVNFKIRFLAAATAVICTTCQISVSNALHAKNDAIADAGLPIAADASDESSSLDPAMAPQWTILAPGVAVFDVMPSGYA